MSEHSKPDHDCEMCRKAKRLAVVYADLRRDFESEAISAFAAWELAAALWEIEDRIALLKSAATICG